MREMPSMGKSTRTLPLWVALSFLIVGMVIGGQSATAFAATPITVGGKAIVSNTGGDPIRIRQDAGTEFPQIATAYGGQTVSVLAGPRSDKAGKPWYKVQAPGGTGWMIAIYLQGTSTSTSTPTTATTKLTGAAHVVNTGGDPLRMRSIASTSGKVLALLNPNEAVTIKSGPLTDTAGTAWYEITARGLTGWAMAQYLAQGRATTDLDVTVANIPEAKPAATEKPAEQPKVETTVAKTQSSGGATSTLGQYRQWMEEARAMYPYPQSIDKMWRVMMCESGGNPRASNGGRYLGLFQYHPGTWGGSWNPYRSNSIWDAKSQIFATAKAWSIGMQSAWSCYYITSGR